MADQPDIPDQPETPQAPTPAPAPKGGVVRLAVPHPHNAFRSGIRNGDTEIVISATGTDVPQGLVEQVRNAWTATAPGRPELREVQR